MDVVPRGDLCGELLLTADLCETRLKQLKVDRFVPILLSLAREKHYLQGTIGVLIDDHHLSYGVEGTVLDDLGGLSTYVTLHLRNLEVCQVGRFGLGLILQ